MITLFKVAAIIKLYTIMEFAKTILNYLDEQTFRLQQGLEIRCFWFQKKTVQLKTALHEVYTYVLNGFFFQKTVYLQGFWPKSVYLKVTVM